MTREEAIHHLYTYSSTNGSGQTTDEQHNEAKRMAIKALEQEPTKNDLGVDCISRAEAIKCLECDFDITGEENMKTVVNYINSAHDKIVNLQRVKQEPKTGHWIEHGIDESYAIPVYTCSECDHFIGVVVSNFCPNCGADMRGEET